MGNNHHGFNNGKARLTNLITFQDKMSRSVDKGSVADIIYLYFIKAFGTVLHNIFVLKLQWYGLNGKKKMTGWLGLDYDKPYSNCRPVKVECQCGLS